VSFLLVTVPVSLLVAGSLLALVIYAVHSGAFDDWDGPAERHAFDDDRVPETAGGQFAPGGMGPVGRVSSPAGGSAGARFEGGPQQIGLGDHADEERRAGLRLDDREAASVDLDEEQRGLVEAHFGGRAGGLGLHDDGDGRLAQPARERERAAAVALEDGAEERAVREAADEDAVVADGQETHASHAHQPLGLEERIPGRERDEAPPHHLADPLCLHVHGREGSS
jgi:cbb3-type cytochrome oxidase maturation protein